MTNNLQDIVLSENDPELREAWNTCLDSFSGASPQQKQELLNSVAIFQSEFIRTLELVSDPVDRAYLTALFYINLKSQWTILNARSGYLIEVGQIDMRNMCRSGLLSALLSKVEEWIPSKQVDEIVHFLTSKVAMSSSESPRENSHSQIGDDGRDNDLGSSPVGDKDSDTREVFTNLVLRITQLEEDLADLRTRNKALVNEFGTCDPETIISRYRDAKSDLNLLDELQSAIGTMERSMIYVNS